ncbi:DUF4373 domain-containing protein [Levilactobacillus suantsaii]|uniref:DUF4373 domain-containing protein n=1 Tax=Levilactobacillus suantsaii TaxID=2292255 RepID=A0A4Q0VG25_9LACO|nr:DUF4373 domain-containing protein [Levilactobacillus suantsaii]QMU08607.1 DUF4373 domain-containing protein [Levilactobacillus suantsaii]RXI77351.1 DUF4373 domain-containing protein [Levilactobacillus suantsaii]
MARPVKKGLEYFSIDVDMLHRMKVRKIMLSCGPQSIAVLVDLLGNIYGDEGYYMQWDDDARFLIFDDVGVKEAAVQEIVTKAAQVGFFDQGMLDKYSILTSSGIQKRYQMAARKKKDSTINPEYDLLDGVIDTDNEVSDAETPVSGADNPQSKAKESKVNKSKKEPKRPHSGKPKYGPDDPPYQIAQHLLKAIRDNDPEFSPKNDEHKLQTWANDIRLAHTQDGHTYDKLDGMVEWCQHDDFWKSNVLSGSKLRKQFDQMKMQAASRGRGSSKPTRAKETLPTWAQKTPDKPASDGKLSPEQQAALDARIKKFKARRPEKEEATS